MQQQRANAALLDLCGLASILMGRHTEARDVLLEDFHATERYIQDQSKHTEGLFSARLSRSTIPDALRRLATGVEQCAGSKPKMTESMPEISFDTDRDQLNDKNNNSSVTRMLATFHSLDRLGRHARGSGDDATPRGCSRGVGARIPPH